MGEVDYNELRRLAGEATPGPWHVNGNCPRWIYTDHDVAIDEADWGQPEGPGARAMQLTLMADSRAWSYANVKFVAAANPVTVLALLDERQAIADRLRGIANLCDCDGPYSALHDLADELDPPKEA